MRVKELIAALETYLGEHGDEYDEVKIWLPGSTISMRGVMNFNEKHQALLIEGNVDPGSALSKE